jgi:hypothetical protein
MGGWYLAIVVVHRPSVVFLLVACVCVLGSSSSVFNYSRIKHAYHPPVVVNYIWP